MEVTGIGKLPTTGASPGVTAKQDSGTDFSSVLGKVLSAGEESETPQKTRSGNSGKRDADSGTKKTTDKTADSDSKTTGGQNTASPTNAQALVGVEQSAAQAAVENSAAPAQGTVSAKTKSDAQAVTTLPPEPTAAGTVVLTPETFTANVKAELQKTADTFQTQLQQAAQGAQQAGQLVQQAAQDAQTVQTAQTVQNTQTTQTVQDTQTVQNSAAQEMVSAEASMTESASVQSHSKTVKSAEQAQRTAGQTAEQVSQPVAVSPQAEDSGTSAQGGENGTAQAETARGPAQTETKKADGTKTATPQFSVTAAAHTPSRTQETSDMQAAVNRALERFDQDFQAVSADSRNIEISLHPKELGTVSISLAAGAGGVTAKIQTTSAEAASLLSDQVQRMIESMEAKGVRVQNVEVVLTQTPQQNAGNGGGSTAQQYQNQTPRIYAAQGAAAEKSSALTDYERITQTCTVPMEDGQRVEYRV